MSKSYTHSDDEIDLLEVFETLWGSKWLISGFVALALAAGFLYTQLATVESITYKLTVPYRLNFYFVGSERVCGNSFICLEERETKKILWMLGNKWSNEGDSQILSLISASPLKITDYEIILREVENKISELALNEAKKELEMVNFPEESEFLINLFCRQVPINVINSKRVIESINDGISVVQFGKPDITVNSSVSPRPFSIFVLSFVSGGLLGTFFVLFRNAIRKRNERISTT